MYDLFLKLTDQEFKLYYYLLEKNAGVESLIIPPIKVIMKDLNKKHTSVYMVLKALKNKGLVPAACKPLKF